MKLVEGAVVSFEILKPNWFQGIVGDIKTARVVDENGMLRVEYQCLFGPANCTTTEFEERLRVKACRITEYLGRST